MTPVPPPIVPEERFRYTGKAVSGWFRAVDLNRYPENRTIWAVEEAFDKVYIGLCGEHEFGAAHLVAYDPKSDTVEEVCDVAAHIGSPTGAGKVPQTKIHFSICKVDGGEGCKVYFGTHCSANLDDDDIEKGVGIGAMCHPTKGYEGGRIFVFHVDEGRCEDLGVAVPHEGIRCMKASPDGTKLFGITYPKVRLFQFDVEARRTTYLSPRLGKNGGIDLFLDEAGRVYGVSDGYKRRRIAGLLYRFHPETQRLEDLRLALPKLGPRCHTRFRNHLLHAAAGPRGDVILSCYGECNIGLFQFGKRGPGRLYDLGLSWDRPEFKENLPYFAWVPQFGKPRAYAVGGRAYDTIVWYGHERWEFKEPVRLNCLAYNHRRPTRVAKVIFGHVEVDGHEAGHWGASACDRKGRIYYGDRYVVNGEAGIRLLIFTPPRKIAPVEKVAVP